VPREQNRNSRRAFVLWQIVPVVVVFFALFLAWRYTPLAEIATAEQMSAWAGVLRQSVWAALVVVLVYTPAAFLMFPRPLLTLFAVLVFGPWKGFAIAMGGILGSAVAIYFTGRALSERAVRRLGGKKFEQTCDVVRARGITSVLAVTIAPLAPFPVVGMAAGAVRIKVRHFLIGTMLGMLPGTLATTVFAHEIERALENPDRINYWVVAAVIAILIALTVFARRWLLKLQAEAKNHAAPARV
jgi:phospholipase D1/2